MTATLELDDTDEDMLTVTLVEIDTEPATLGDTDTLTDGATDDDGDADGDGVTEELTLAVREDETLAVVV